MATELSSPRKRLRLVLNNGVAVGPVEAAQKDLFGLLTICHEQHAHIEHGTHVTGAARGRLWLGAAYSCASSCHGP